MFSQRYVMCVVCFLLILSALTVRMNFPIAMIAMVNYTAIGVYSQMLANLENVSLECNASEPEMVQCLTKRSETEPSHPHLEDGEFVWTPETQGMIIGVQSWGSAGSKIPAAWMAQRYGGKVITVVGFLLLVITAVLHPVVAYSVPLLCFVRIIGGLGDGASFAGLTCLSAKWMPMSERGRMSGIMMAGSPTGNVVALAVTGLLTDSGLFGGWPSSFYVFGAFGFVIAFLCWILLYETPGSHPWISNEERKYIESSVIIRKKESTPWKAIITSPPVWALMLSMVAYTWTHYTLYALVPTYMKVILHFDLKSNGLISATPYIFRVMVVSAVSLLVDLCSNRGLSPTTNRKLFITMSLSVPAILLVSTMYMDNSGTNRIWNVVLLVLGMGLMGGYFMTAFINQTDLSPNFAGPIGSFINLPGQLMGFLGPYTAGLILSDLGDINNWRMVFLIAGAMCISGNVVYILFGSAELQLWDDVAGMKKKNNEDRPGERYGESK